MTMWFFGQRRSQTEATDPFVYRFAMRSDIGCVREVNEDSARVVQLPDRPPRTGRGLLVVVADGMGGSAAGEVASRMAVETIEKTYYASKGEPGQALVDAFQDANRAIWRMSSKNAEVKGMGTTCTALVLRDAQAFVAHVGDTRLYLVRGADAYLMTQDHSLVMEMVRRGELTLEQARRHEDRNVIRRALGIRPAVEIATWEEPFPLRDGDRFLLCSDGLHDLVDHKAIVSAVLKNEPQQACERLVEQARAEGGYDNITAVVVAVSARKSELIAKPTREVEVTA
jgi:serine/threonine protein phosphatase PrpC